MRPFLVLLSAAAGLAGCATATVYGIVGDENDIYTGSAVGYMTRNGTIELKNTKGNACKGDFSYFSGVLAGNGIITCDDGQRANIEFIGLTSLSGYGRGISSNGRRVAFTYGMDREQSLRYLGLRGFGAAVPGGAAASGSATPPAAAGGGTGTGFYINRQGHIL